ncbi:MAG TPA: SLBB domain-containing protein [Candidatus Saccharimonadales bacterium]|nr:SLBB domain-containing protein [Candidatus Saccharimonadales bacterium]
MTLSLPYPIRKHRLARGALGALLIGALAAAPAAQAAPVAAGRLYDFPTGAARVELGSSLDSAAAAQAPLSGVLLSGPVDPATYVLGPGDVLSLEKGSPAGTSQLLQVDAEGALYLPDLGRRAVAGQTLAQARRSLLDELKVFVPRARVDLRLQRPRTFKVFLLGETTTPGPVVAMAANRAVEAVLARGPLPHGASQRNIVLQRATGATQRVDVQSFLLLGDQAHNPWLADGDRLIVPTLREQIYLSGSVARAGSFELAPGDSLSTLLRLGGGLTAGANAESLLLVRFRGATATESLWLSVDRDAALALLPDDRVFVRTRQPWHPVASVTVEGEVFVPGVYPIREGYDRVSDLLPRLGGYTSQASLTNVELVRIPDPTQVDAPDLDRLRRLTRAEMTQSEYLDLKMRTEGRAAAYQLDLSDGLAPGSSQDVLLRNGDRLVVGSLARTVRVGGAVVRPGLFPFRAELSPEHYVDLAGGYGERADKGGLRVIRVADGQSLPADEAGRLTPGDFVWVPERPDRPAFWGVFRDIVSVAGQIVTVIWVVTKTK